MKICSKKDIKALTGIMAASLLFSGCTVTKQKDKPLEFDPNIKTEINLNKISDTEYDDNEMDALYRNYCLNLFRQTASDDGSNKNIMISPASVMMALDMLAAGTKGDSLKQLTELFASGKGPLEQQAYAAALMDKINSSKDVEFSCANAVWSDEAYFGNKINAEYVDYIKETFLAEYKVTVFDDKTPDEINGWVDNHTKHMIKKVIEQLDPNTVMVLVNAIYFDGKWEEKYEAGQINDGEFTKSDGGKQKATFLSDSTRRYFETDKATGFMKNYEGGEYAFLAILPKDDSISANDFAKDFTAKDYEDFIKSVTAQYEVRSKMPEFNSDYEIAMNDTLKNLGCKDIFDPSKADLSGIAGVPGDLYVSKVIHKTHIEVDRTGTKAAAVTVVEVDCKCAVEETPIKTVNCDRPFVYAIVDTKTMTPVFMGTVNEI
ncbi:MAG: serpin family protein [Clostridiales bacterium]|nr:serpin family protein [Clostridiales bacterium]